MANKKIVIGVPCYGNVVPEILEDWMVFAYHCGRRLPQFDFHVAIKTKSEQFRARNAIVEAAIQVDADWLLMIDDDMIIDHERITREASSAYNFLQLLISHDKDICGVLYYQRHGECSPVLMNRVGTGGYRFLRDNEIEHRLQKVDVAGGGCLLIKMKVFDKVKQPYFAPEFQYGTDIQLCQRATEAGFEVWADTSIEFGHIRDERVIVTSRNRTQYQTSDLIPGDVRRFISEEVYERLVVDAEEYTGESRVNFARRGNLFMDQARRGSRPVRGDINWYRQHGHDRIMRQIHYNMESQYKRNFTEFIMTTVDHKSPRRILDFGCGIGITAFFLAEKGHTVTACDLEGTETLQFLKWRTKKHNKGMFVYETEGRVPDFPDQFDVIIAMDCLEHIEGWRGTLQQLASYLPKGGILFANNAVLDDTNHPEHFDLKPADFVAACASNGLLPVNQITYMKG